ncbi:MAG: thiamine phosphate synthase [Gemmatimonadota bacterium]
MDRLRVMVVTAPRPACGRPLPEIVVECAEAGATAIQLRDKEANGEELFRQAMALRRALSGRAALLLVNDRLDVALAAGADGVHLGPEDLPVAGARAVAPDGFLIGYSTDDPAAAREAAAAGADYLGVGAVFSTRSKAGLAEEAIGPDRVRAALAAARLPGLGIGGISAANAARVAETGAGVAVLGAVMGAPHPGDVVAAIRAEVDRAHASLAEGAEIPPEQER